jgi:hypothetical protein
VALLNRQKERGRKGGDKDKAAKRQLNSTIRRMQQFLRKNEVRLLGGTIMLPPLPPRLAGLKSNQLGVDGDRRDDRWLG